jgi:L-rhamnose isomerase
MRLRINVGRMSRVSARGGRCVLLDTSRADIHSLSTFHPPPTNMARFTSEQLAFARTQTRYLGRAEAIAFLRTMDIKMSVGHWSAGDFCDRFAPPGYHSDDATFTGDFAAQCRRTHAAGVDAIEIHQSVFEKTLNGDIDWQAVERARDGHLAELAMRVTACNINTWSNPRFRLGGPCNPNPALRREALDEIMKGVEIAKSLKIPVLSVWPGSDGADYHFQIDYQQSLEWFTEALVAVNRECLKAGIKLAVEPKPYEPRELYMIIPTAAAAILVAQRVNQACGGSNCGLTIDYGHQKMEGTTASTACDLAAYAGVPVHKFDINDARQGRNDQDCMFGTLSIPESVEYLFTTFVRDYRGYYSQDQFTYRDDPTRAMERSMVNFANLALKAVRVLEQQSALEKARAAGTGPDVLDIVSPILVG